MCRWSAPWAVHAIARRLARARIELQLKAQLDVVCHRIALVIIECVIEYGEDSLRGDRVGGVRLVVVRLVVVRLVSLCTLVISFRRSGRGLGRGSWGRCCSAAVGCAGASHSAVSSPVTSMGTSSSQPTTCLVSCLNSAGLRSPEATIFSSWRTGRPARGVVGHFVCWRWARWVRNTPAKV